MGSDRRWASNTVDVQCRQGEGFLQEVPSLGGETSERHSICFGSCTSTVGQSLQTRSSVGPITSMICLGLNVESSHRNVSQHRERAVSTEEGEF